MPEINIKVRKKYAEGDGVVICNNSDYTVLWDLDEEWTPYDTKTMRVNLADGTYQDVVFSGDSAALPVLTASGWVSVGLYAGDIRTTRAARLLALSSVLTSGGAPAAPAEDVYAQLMERMAQLEAPDWNQNDPAAKDYVKNRTHWVEDDGTVHKLDEKFLPDSSAVSFAAQTLTDAQKSQARENIGAQEYICSSKEIPEETIANFVVQYGQFSSNFNFSKSLEVGKTYKVYNNDSFIESTASEFNGNIQLSITNGVIGHPIGKPEEGFYNGAPTNFGEYLVCVPAHTEVEKIPNKYIPTLQSDWNQNDATAKDYIKNRTHYVSQESKAVVPEQEVTTAVQNNFNIAILNDVDFDALKTLFNSKDNTTFDVVFDDTLYQCKWLEQNGARIPGFGNLAITDPSLTDTGEPFCTSLGESNARDILTIACKVAGTHTVAVSCSHDVVHTIAPKYIKDMYYSEIAETIIGYGMDGWAVITKNEAVPIPKMAIRGKVYENVPVDHTQMENVVYVVGGYTLTFNRMNSYMTTEPSDLSGADVAFYGQGTVYHQMPAWAVNLGGQGIYVADTTSSSKVVLDKMPEDCHFVVAINLSPSFTTDTVRYRGEDSPIISCKTRKQITYNAIPKYAMLLALTDDGWICVNPIA